MKRFVLGAVLMLSSVALAQEAQMSANKPVDIVRASEDLPLATQILGAGNVKEFEGILPHMWIVRNSHKSITAYGGGFDMTPPHPPHEGCKANEANRPIAPWVFFREAPNPQTGTFKTLPTNYPLIITGYSGVIRQGAPEYAVNQLLSGERNFLGISTIVNSFLDMILFDDGTYYGEDRRGHYKALLQRPQEVQEFVRTYFSLPAAERAVFATKTAADKSKRWASLAAIEAHFARQNIELMDAEVKKHEKTYGIIVRPELQK